ncbi:RNA-directed DNA polymerase, eukaryota, reverse transcriptase zinc-binding domain protein [Tanacetum coccineum]
MAKVPSVEPAVAVPLAQWNRPMLQKEPADAALVPKIKTPLVNNEKKGKNKEETEGSRNVNKFDALNRMEEDIEELEKLKGMMVVDTFLNKRIQPNFIEVKSWTQDMVKYFNEQWEIDRDKEAEEENKHIEDVLDNNIGIAKEISIEEMEGWDKDKVDVMVVHMTRQVMLVVVEIIKLKQKVFCSFVYASNSGIERRSLWNNLRRFKASTYGCPWILMGDFNVTLKLEEHSAGGSKVHSDMQEFGGCVNDIEVEDVNFTGLFYTWIKSPSKPETSILKKLDRVMVNSDFIDHYGNVNARFLPFLISDHSPVVLHIPNTLEKKKKSFRFSNFVADKEEFIDVLAWKKGNLFQSVKILEDELKKAQMEVEANPNCKGIKEKLSNVLQEYNEVIIDEEK